MLGRRSCGSAGDGWDVSHGFGCIHRRSWLLSSTLSGILRLSPRRSVVTLKVWSTFTVVFQFYRFFGLGSIRQIGEKGSAPSSWIAGLQRCYPPATCCYHWYMCPHRQFPVYHREMDAGALDNSDAGTCTWSCEQHSFACHFFWFLSPQIPISTTIHRCTSNFRKTHQDTWHEDSQRFTDDQLAAMSTLLTGSSYCECNGCWILLKSWHIVRCLISSGTGSSSLVQSILQWHCGSHWFCIFTH